METRSTVFIVDDDETIREFLRQLVESVAHTAETYATARAFLKAITAERPGCVVLDVRLPGMSGSELQRALEARDIHLPIIMTAGQADVPMAVEAMKAGAFDFVEKPFHSLRILDSIRRACAYDRRLRPIHTRRNDIRSRVTDLSRREREVLDLVCEGLASSEIASRLGIRVKTVEVYRSHINRKMGARNAADLVRMMHCLMEPVRQELAAQGGGDVGARARWKGEREAWPAQGWY